MVTQSQRQLWRNTLSFGELRIGVTVMVCYVDKEYHRWWNHLFPIPSPCIHEGQLHDGVRILDAVLDIADTMASSR